MAVLGKHINKIRKKTENEKLSKRIRKLIEKWREAILSNDSESNGNNDVPISVNPPEIGKKRRRSSDNTLENITIKKSKISESNNLSCTDELLINWIRKIDQKKDEIAKKDPNNLRVQVLLNETSNRIAEIIQ
ncbi:hypothetical protein WA026_018263 [Henosepilachna vigintioctopunctata]|uniref:TFIIS N-terminal domain-containing protein n=1 Tax=Henosepilachna vigintioctopunctata TaxID=420089 RepID=A0AAW1VE12_9CUCU